jgi:hypothetical protein
MSKVLVSEKLNGFLSHPSSFQHCSRHWLGQKNGGQNAKHVKSRDNRRTQSEGFGDHCHFKWSLV